jgi:CHAT domain-containing protein
MLSITACSQRDSADPVRVFTISLPVSGTAPIAFERALAPGAWLIEVREQQIDLRTRISLTGESAEAADEVPRHGVYYEVVSTPVATVLHVTVRNADHGTKSGSALVSISRWQRSVNAAPGELERGFAAFGAAGRETALGTRESRTRAADHLHEAVALFTAAENDGAIAQAQYSLANLQYLKRNEWAAAIRAAEAAADAYGAEDDAHGEHNAATLRAAAELELASGMKASTQRAEQRALYDAADQRLREAAEYFDGVPDPIRAAYAVNMRGIRALLQGNYEEAATFFAAAVERAGANGDVSERVKSQQNLAWVNNRRGYIARAADQYAALLPLLERDRQPYEYAQMLGNYGFCLIQLGDFDRAMSVQTEALAIYTEIGQEDERAVMMSALGGLYFRIGDTERALATLRLASSAQERVGDIEGQAATLRVAGNAAAALGKYAEALEYLRQSAQIDGNPNSVARTRVMMAAQLRMLGDLAGGEAELAQALSSANPLVHASALEERARLRIAQSKLVDALADMRAADARFAELGLDLNRVDTQTAVSRLLLEQRDVAGAARAADEAVSIVSRVRVKSTNPEWRARFLSSRYSPYEARIAVDFAAARDDPTAGAWQAFRTAELVRARSLADELAVEAPARGSGEDQRDDELRAKATFLQGRLETRMQRQQIDEIEIANLQRAIEETRAQIDAQRAAVAARDPTLPASLGELRAKLPARTAVLAYFVGDAVSHAWLLTRDELRHVSVVGRAELQTAIEAAVLELRESKAPGRANRALGKALLANLLDGIHETRMLVLPDGPLNGVPFAALTIPGSDRMLVSRFVLGYAPSLALALRPAEAGRRRPTRVAVVSDPVYASDDQRLRLAGAVPGNLRGQPRASPNSLTRLPYSALEARAVAKAFGERDTIQLSGFDATTDRVLQLESSQLAVLHFATHAVARRDSPEQSALYLSEFASDGTSLANSRLTASDVMRSGLHADVVVLSGCATGDGSELRGEGVLGLTYGFLANGADSVVAALWPIEDASTARFMSEFYRAYRESGSAAVAVREAQLRAQGTAATAAWSSFVVRANDFP